MSKRPPAGSPGLLRRLNSAAVLHVVREDGPASRAAIVGHEVLAEPFDVGNGFLKVAFVLADGAVVEFMQYTNQDEEGWF